MPNRICLSNGYSGLALGVECGAHSDHRPPLDRERAGSVPIPNLVTVGFMSSSIPVPRIGMLATVRSRRGVVTSVEPFEESRSSERLHLVTVEYSDYDGAPEEALLWERECRPEILEPNALPRVDGEPPMPPEDLLALQRATRWSAITPFLSADSPKRLGEAVPTALRSMGPVSADDFQMVPLARAMKMPRISMLAG